LVTLRFNQPRVHFEKQLYTAISKALEVKPDVTFEVVSLAPTSADAKRDAAWQSVAGHNTRAVIAAMQQMGVPAERISVTGQAASGIAFDETHVYAR
jgi:hypothetical protein